jgi:hypothetical protein
MKSNVSNFVTCQQMTALMRYKVEHVLQHLFFHLSWLQIDLLKGCVATVHEIEACNEHSSGGFKQRALIKFFTAEGVSLIEIHCRMQVAYGDYCVDVSPVCH